MTGLFAPKFENKVQKKQNKKPPTISLWKCSSHIIFLQSKRLGYRTCTVHFKVIHEHFSQTFKPSICLHKKLIVWCFKNRVKSHDRQLDSILRLYRLLFSGAKWHHRMRWCGGCFGSAFEQWEEAETSLFMSMSGESRGTSTSLCGRCVSKSKLAIINTPLSWVCITSWANTHFFFFFPPFFFAQMITCRQINFVEGTACWNTSTKSDADRAAVNNSIINKGHHT